MKHSRAMGLGSILACVAVAASCSTTGTSSTTEEQLTPAEVVATQYLEAYGNYDMDRAADLLLGPDQRLASGTEQLTFDEWRLGHRWLQAIGYKVLVDRCQEVGKVAVGLAAVGTSVRCTYVFHALGSDELGLGPFPDNAFNITVRDGQVAEAVDWSSAADGVTQGGFDDTMWTPFRVWMFEVHPDDLEILDADPATDESIALWAQRTREYVEQHRGQSPSPSASR